MHRYTVELRVVGPDLDPDQVTKMLGVPPTHVRRKSDMRRMGSSKLDMWCHEILRPDGLEWSLLAEALTELLQQFEPIRNRLLECAASNDILLWCGHFTSSFGGGPVLPAELLKRLGDFGAQLVIDTYTHTDFG